MVAKPKPEYMARPSSSLFHEFGLMVEFWRDIKDRTSMPYVGYVVIMTPFFGPKKEIHMRVPLACIEAMGGEHISRFLTLAMYRTP
jgi:hypothetical protein